MSNKKFIKQFCKKCSICINTKQTYFCRNMYATNAKKFTNRCFSKLKSIGPAKIMEKLKDPNIIKDIFCSAKICKNCKKDKSAIDICSNSFCDQILQLKYTDHTVKTQQKSLFTKLLTKCKKPKTKCKKSKNKVETSFIFGGNDEWVALVNSIKKPI